MNAEAPRRTPAIEQLAGNGVTATIRVPGASPIKAVVHDLSRAGVALRHGGSLPIGQEIEIDLLGAGGPVTGRVVRTTGNITAFEFKEGPGMLARIDRCLMSLSAATKAA